MKKQRLNIELFKKIREKIATTPDAYDQETYGRRNDYAPCGTAACIAGWACVLGEAEPLETVRSLHERYVSGDKEIVKRIPSTAKRLLGLTQEEADVLFYGDPSGYNEDTDEYEGGWPQPFADRWDAGIDDRSSIAIDYIDHIIETGTVLE